MSKSEVGRLAEKLVSAELAKNGYEIITYNYRKPWGEIDIVARKNNIIAFVEVKASRELISGFEPELRADRKKIQRVIRTARTYLAEKRYPSNQSWQIDVVAVTVNERGELSTFNHFENIDV